MNMNASDVNQIETYKPPQVGMAYFDKRIEGEVDLVSEVAKAMRSGGILQEKIDIFLNSHLIVSAKEKPALVQRHLINRWSKLQLNCAPVPTLNESYFLVPDGDLRHWLTMYEQSIIPFFLRAGLPVDYTKAHVVRQPQVMVGRAG